MPDRPHVLVADADPLVSASLTETLAGAGHAVSTAGGPGEVSAVPAGVGLVVVGGVGDGVTAAEAARAVRRGGDQTPVLILTDGPDPAAAALAAADPSVRTLPKPFTTADLTAAVAAALPPR